jgi:quercetin dioxygenase-like cupin family protein
LREAAGEVDMRVVAQQDMELERGNKPGEPQHFTGTVWMLRCSVPPFGTGIHQVFFEREARTHWHRHPEGQILYVVSGRGLVQKLDEKKGTKPSEEISAGDFVYFAPNEKHWHGARSDSFMVHVAITPRSRAGETCWEEEVSPEDYSVASLKGQE